MPSQARQLKRIIVRGERIGLEHPLRSYDSATSSEERVALLAYNVLTRVSSISGYTPPDPSVAAIDSSIAEIFQQELSLAGYRAEPARQRVPPGAIALPTLHAISKR